MQFQSGVFVEFASVTGVLGAGEEVAVDFGLEDGMDEVDALIVDVLGWVDGVVTTAVAECVRLARLMGAAVFPTLARRFVATDDGRAWTRTPSHSGPGVPGSIRRSKGVTALPALFAAAELDPWNVTFRHVDHVHVPSFSPSSPAMNSVYVSHGHGLWQQAHTSRPWPMRMYRVG